MGRNIGFSKKIWVALRKVWEPLIYNIICHCPITTLDPIDKSCPLSDVNGFFYAGTNAVCERLAYGC